MPLTIWLREPAPRQAHCTADRLLCDQLPRDTDSSDESRRRKEDGRYFVLYWPLETVYILIVRYFSGGFFSFFLSFWHLKKYIRILSVPIVCFGIPSGSNAGICFGTTALSPCFVGNAVNRVCDDDDVLALTRFPEILPACAHRTDSH